MTGSSIEQKKPNPLGRAALAGLVAGIAAGLISYIFAGILGFVIGFVAGVLVGSRTVMMMDKARETPS